MEIHFMIFVSIEISFLLVSAFLFAAEERGRTWPPPLNEQDLSALRCDASGDLVEGRVRDLVVLHLRNSLDHFRECLLHFWIGCAAVSFRILFLVPEADPDRFQSPRGDQGDFVLEAFLFSQQGNDFVLKGSGKLRNVVGFQTHGHTSSKHSQPPWLSSKTYDCR